MKSLIALVIIVAASTLSAQDAPKHHAAPKYSTLLGEDFSGSGFHFALGDKRYIACSLHQYEGKVPSAMGSMAFDTPIRIMKRVYAGEDIQVLSYASAELDKVNPLTFDSTVTPAIGDRVYCYSGEDSYEGEIIAVASDKRNYSVKVAKLYPAGGNSGSPIVSAVKGTVVGVLLTANDDKAASIVGFELLKLQPEAEQRGAGQPATRQVHSSNPLLGEWVHNLETLKKYYESSDLAKAVYKTWEEAQKEVLSGTSGIDVTFSRDTLTYMRNGRKTISYPYVLIRAENEWVEIEYTHFLGGKRRMLFKMDEGVLLEYYTDLRQWHPLRAYVKKPPQQQSK